MNGRWVMPPAPPAARAISRPRMRRSITAARVRASDDRREHQRVADRGDQQRPQHADSDMVGAPVRLIEAGWCSVFHQSTLNLMIGRLTTPTSARIAPAR